MGVSSSVPLDPAFQTIASCKRNCDWHENTPCTDSFKIDCFVLSGIILSSGPWSKVQSALKAYADGEFDFCIDADTIADITCLSDADTNRLVKLLSKNNSGV